MKHLIHFFQRGRRKPHPSILYRMHYLTCGAESAAYHTGAIQ